MRAVNAYCAPPPLLPSLLHTCVIMRPPSLRLQRRHLAR